MKGVLHYIADDIGCFSKWCDCGGVWLQEDTERGIELFERMLAADAEFQRDHRA